MICSATLPALPQQQPPKSNLIARSGAGRKRISPPCSAPLRLWQPERWTEAKKTTFLRAATARVRALAKTLGLPGPAVVLTVEPSHGDCPGGVLLRSAKLFIWLRTRAQPIGPPTVSVLVRRVRALEDFAGVAGMDTVLLSDELSDVDLCAKRVTQALLLNVPLPERQKRS